MISWNCILEGKVGSLYGLIFPIMGYEWFLLGYLQLKMATYNGMLTFNLYMVHPIQGQYLYFKF